MRAQMRQPISMTLAGVLCGGVLGTNLARAADPTTADCVSASEASIDLRTAHKLREARAQALVCAASSCPADVRAECLRRVDEVNAGIPTVVFEAKDAAGSDLAGIKVTMDGQPLSERLEGTALSLNPGQHRFVFEAPGGGRVEKTLVLHEAEKERRERIVFSSEAAPPAIPAVGPQFGPLEPPAEGQPAEPTKGDSRRPIGLVLGGVGVAGLAVGVGFGLIASSKWSSSKDECASATSCPNHAQAVTDHDAATTAATISTLGLVGGGVLAATGAILFLTAPRRSTTGIQWQVAPTVGSGGGGLVLKGTM